MITEIVPGLSLVGGVIGATILVVRRREQVRAAARGVEKLNVISNDTRCAFWYAGADPYDGGSDSSDSCGGGTD